MNGHRGMVCMCYRAEKGGPKGFKMYDQELEWINNLFFILYLVKGNGKKNK